MNPPAPAAAAAPVAMPTVQSILAHRFRRYRSRVCLRWEGGTASYAETASRVAAVAHWIQERTGPGARVAILLDNGREYVEAMLTCTAAGRVRVPLNAREPAELLAKKLDQVEVTVLVTAPALWEQIEPLLAGAKPHVLLAGEAYDEVAGRGGDIDTLAPTTAAEVYRLSFTGGTTGTAKAVVQTHRQELAMVRNLLLEAIRPAADAVYVASTPLSHAAGAFVLPVVLGGGSLAWTPRYDPARLVDASWLGGELGVQTFVVPTALADLAEAAEPGHVLETVIYGGAPCPQPVLARAVERIGLDLVQIYGQAEAPMTICVLDKESHADLDAIQGSVGHPFTFVDVWAEENGVRQPPGSVGEVVVRGEHIMSGYWGNEAETAERLRADGCLLTQDLGFVDEDGRVRLVGRARELVISGGFNVYPDDLERRIGTLAGVAELAIFGVPHDRWGEAVVVAAVPASGSDRDEARVLEELKRERADRLASYEQPKRVVFVDELPLTSVGKVSRKDLAARFGDLFAGEG